AMFADPRTGRRLHGGAGARRFGWSGVKHLFALARIGEAFILGDDKAAALCACQEKLAAALVAKGRHDIGLLLEIDEKPDWLSMTAATGKLRSIESIESAVAGEHQTSRCRLGCERELWPVVDLECNARQVCDGAA